MHAAAADRMLARLESIEWENPHIDRPGVERAVTAHLAALEMPVVPLRWYPHPLAWGTASRRPDPHYFQSRVWGHSRRVLWDPSAPPESELLGGRVRSDAQLYELNRSADMERFAAPVTPHVLHAIRAIRNEITPPPPGPPSHWWRGDVPDKALPAVERLAEAAAAGLFAIWHTERSCLLVPRPSLRVDGGQLHCWDGAPAAAWKHGPEYYFWRGVLMPHWIGAQPEDLTAEEIRSWQSAERRSVAIERFGYERYLKHVRARLVGTDRFGKLWRSSGRNQVAYVEVVNSTPEPDGSRKTYFLSVPPDLSTPRAAVAWTFGLGPEQYAPTLET